MNKLAFLQFIKTGDIRKAKMLVQFFYYTLFFIAVDQLINVLLLVNRGPEGFVPQWPVFWATYIGNYAVVAESILFLFLLTSLFSCFYYHRWWGRAVAFVGLLEFQAFTESFGSILHHWDPWVYVAFFFMLLPDVWGERKETEDTKDRFLTLFWGAQAFILLIYSMAGMWKAIGAIQQMLAGEASMFSFDSPALHVATQFVRQSGDATSVLGPFVIDHPLYAWLPFVAVIYLQLVAFWVAFKPDVQRLWALGLMGLHIGVFLVMNIPLFQYVFLVLILFADSPFRNVQARLIDIFYDIPVFGPLARYGLASLAWAGRRILPYNTKSRV